MLIIMICSFFYKNFVQHVLVFTSLLGSILVKSMAEQDFFWKSLKCHDLVVAFAVLRWSPLSKVPSANSRSKSWNVLADFPGLVMSLAERELDLETEDITASEKKESFVSL